MRALIVDDSEDDALLIADELRSSGRDLTYARVDTPEAMAAALHERTWDIIIADYRMPRFSGPDALRLLHQTGLDIPLILVSGTAEEHTGVDMMRAGAADFIMKHSLGRLVPAVIREMGEAESRRQRKKAEDAARTSAENYRMFFEHAPVPVVTYNRDAVILQVNPAFEQLFGFASHEVVGRQICETFGRFQDSQRTQAQARQIFAGEVVKNAEYERVTKDGREVCILANITPVTNEEGEIIMALAMMTDITEHRQAEANQRDFYRRTILAATNGKLLICERDELGGLAGDVMAAWEVTGKGELSAMRDSVARIAMAEGMEESRVPYLLGCVMEAAANAVKHGNGGRASLHRTPDGLIFMISDSGPGIGALALPEVALIKGYSTAGTLGMGYKIMIEYSDKVFLATGPQGTTVAIEMRLNAAESEAEALLQTLPGW